MDNNTLFMVMTGLSGLGWLLLILTGPCWKNADKAVMGVIVLILASAYCYFNFAHLKAVGGITAFVSYEGVQRVFANDGLQLAAWAHILALDLVAGVWMLNNARLNKIRHLIMIPIYFVTIMLAPLGLILYMIIRAITTKSWFADNGAT